MSDHVCNDILCKNKNLLKFKVSSKDCSRFQINAKISEVPLSKWSNVEDLVDYMCPDDSKSFRLLKLVIIATLQPLT